MYGLISDNELYHHGILGMKWGVRRYQNPDGSLTSAGRKRYLTSNGKLTKEGKQKYAEFKKLTKDDAFVKRVHDQEVDQAKRLSNITRPYHQQEEEVYQRIIGSKQFKTMDEYDKAYSKYKNEISPIKEQMQIAIKEGKLTFKDTMDEYRDLYIDALDLRTVNNGRELVDKFIEMDLDEMYSKRP